MINKDYIKKRPLLRKWVMWLITPSRNPRPRLWVRYLLNPFYHKRGKGSCIRKRSRIDVFPWHKFNIGEYSTIEDFTTVNNGAGDVIIGDYVRVGIGSVLIGPVIMESGSGLGQHVFVSGFNHGYKDGNINSSKQPLDKKQTVIGAESHIGANSVVVAGVHIGKRCQIGAGSVVTKDIPDHCVAVGNPVRIIKRWNPETNCWESTSSS